MDNTQGLSSELYCAVAIKPHAVHADDNGDERDYVNQAAVPQVVSTHMPAIPGQAGRPYAAEAQSQCEPWHSLQTFITFTKPASDVTHIHFSMMPVQHAAEEEVLVSAIASSSDVVYSYFPGKDRRFCWECFAACMLPDLAWVTFGAVQLTSHAIHASEYLYVAVPGARAAYQYWHPASSQGLGVGNQNDLHALETGMIKQ